LSHSGSGRSGSQQPTGTWGYESYTPGLTWIEQEVNLSSYINRQIKVRFRVAADGGEQRDGMYVDDVRFYGYLSAPPVPPALASPANGATDQPTTVTHIWNASAGAAQYRLQVSQDSTFTSTVFDDSTIASTSRVVGPLSPGTLYYWRVRGKNGAGVSPWSAPWSYTTTLVVTNEYSVITGWNLVSVPLTVSDGRKTFLFPNATSEAFFFDPVSGYSAQDTLINGQGYWLKFGGPELVSITGIPRTRDTIDVVTGWNFIGSISGPVDTASVVQIPAGIVESAYYGFNAGYTAVDTLGAGKAFWLKANAPGQLVLSLSTASPARIGKVPAGARTAQPARKTSVLKP
jgi:hypothetical protein